MDIPPILLASNSPRRRQLLALGGWAFTVAASNVDESVRPNEAPAAYVRRLAEAKARAVAAHAPESQVIIGSDTTVVIDGEILGKPVDAEDAARMLRRLRGRTHQVFTGLALLRLADDSIHAEVCVTDVPMRAYTDDEIARYVATGDPLDKAGAYAIQHRDFNPVAGMSGCFASVMGLPLCHLTRLLRAFEVAAQKDVPQECQALLDYHCPVFEKYL
jgi:MAF protein